ncbi:hypothetical protein [Winogradskyella ouciana]|uniref:hypothetical protein n=1 Tax=Winogradskyella ouciana TaxID=2608631 RepID=UPI003D29425E
MTHIKARLRAILVCFLIISLLGCETRFEDNTRILVNGVIKDQSDLAVQDAQINVYTRRVTSFLGGESEFLLGSNFSDSNGEFSVVSLFDEDEDFSIEIDAGETYSKYVYRTNTVDFTPTDFTFNLETVTLQKLSKVNYSVTRTSGDGNSIQYTFRFINGFCSEVYEQGVLNPEESQCNTLQFLNGSLNDNNPDREGSFDAPIGTQVEFTYSINEAPETTEIFTINDNSVNEFTFTY